MRAGRTLFAVCALGFAASAAAIPSAPDEAGIIRNPPLESSPVTPADQATNVDAYFARYDANHDGVVSWQEAQVDPELVNVFARADADGNGMLTPAEFRTAAVLAANGRAARRG